MQSQLSIAGGSRWMPHNTQQSETYTPNHKVIEKFTSTKKKQIPVFKPFTPKFNGNSEIDQMKPHNKGQTISWRRIPEYFFTKECYNGNKNLLE